MLPEVNWKDFWQHDFVSYRRYLIDRHLESQKCLMDGIVLDMGGKRERKRGSFRPPESQFDEWIYINLARETQPHVVADVLHVPFANALADCVICTEVLEHLAEPSSSVTEVHRVLKYGGVLIASVPFLYPVHADPHDFQRFTQEGLRHLCREFDTINIESMGGYWGVVGMFLELGMGKRKGGWRPAVGLKNRSITALARLLYYIDHRSSTLGLSFTTGYFVLCIK